MNTPIKTYTITEAKKKMEYYCAYQERCHKEVKIKLGEMRMIPDAIDLIIAHLIQENYINEERFALSFTRGKFRQKQWGRLRIKRELKQREISDYLITKALKEIQTDYDKVFQQLAEKRLKQLTKETNKYKKRKKLADYLAYRGWEGDLIYEFVIHNI